MNYWLKHRTGKFVHRGRFVDSAPAPYKSQQAALEAIARWRLTLAVFNPSAKHLANEIVIINKPA